FRLSTCRIDEAPSYAAISYTCGQDTETQGIRVDGKRFSVKPNLWSCLHYVTKDPRWDYFWVDAICTNQFNDAEKS
ncbi:hypothetical protein BAUCODRAFT_43814, partial [Baudoinia panamericana UAMH 10762]